MKNQEKKWQKQTQRWREKDRETHREPAKNRKEDNLENEAAARGEGEVRPRQALGEPG